MMAIVITVACSMTGGLLLLFAYAFLLSLAHQVQRGWARLYTRHLPSDLRDAKREDVAAFYAEWEIEQRALGYKPEQIGLRLLATVAWGAKDDLAWRWEIAARSSQRWTRRDKAWAGECVVVMLQALIFPMFVWEQFGSPVHYFPIVVAATAIMGTLGAVFGWQLWRYQKREAVLLRDLGLDEQTGHEENG